MAKIPQSFSEQQAYTATKRARDATPERIADALRFVDFDDRDTWARMAMAVKSELGDAGFDAWDAWGAQSEAHNPADARAVWRSVSVSGGVGIGSLFRAAREAGWIDASDDEPVSAEASEELARRAAEEATERARRAAEEAEQKNKRHDAARAAAKAIWAAGKPATGHQYLANKMVNAVDTLRQTDADGISAALGYPFTQLAGSILIGQIRQPDGTVSSLEFIDANSKKTSLAGGVKAGGFWLTAQLPMDNGHGAKIAICEGIATTLSVTQACGAVGVATLSNANMQKVADAIRHMLPDADILVCADIDKESGAPDKYAIGAARAIKARLAAPAFGASRQPNQTDFNDLHVAFGLDAVRLQVDGATIPGQGEADTPTWNDPQPISGTVPATDYPVDALPPVIRQAVEEVARYVKAPVAIVAMSALSAVSTACQGYTDVRRAERLQGPSGVYTLTLAESGERKTSCDDRFFVAIREYEKQQAEALKPALKKHAALLQAWAGEHEGIMSAIKDASKKGKPVDALRERLINLEAEKPEEPMVPRLILGDETTESLAFSLAKKWPSAAVISSEAGIIFGGHAMGKENVMRNLAFLNVAWDGGVHSVGRKTTDSFVVRGARMTLGLMVQPQTLQDFYTKNGALARGSGFMARFLIAHPETTMGTRKFEEPPRHWPMLDAFNRRIAEVLRRPIPLDEDGILQPDVLDFTPEAKKRWIQYHDTVEAELGGAGSYSSIKDVASKSAENVARLACLFSSFAGADRIGAADVRSAATVALWHLQEAMRFFDGVAQPPEHLDAIKLEAWLIATCKKEGVQMISKNEAMQYGPHRTKDALDAAIKELITRERLRMISVSKKAMLEINPALLK